MAISAIEMGFRMESVGIFVAEGLALMGKTQLLINNNFPICAVTFKPTNAKNAGHSVSVCVFTIINV